MTQLEIFCETLRGKWGWVVIWAICLVVVLLLYILGEAVGLEPWGPIGDAAKYACEQCEHIARSGFFRQVANFWSNFAYLAAGLMILCSGESMTERATGIALVRKSTGLTFVALAIGSGLFHGTITGWGKFLDIAGVYLAFLALVFYGVLVTFKINLPQGRVRLPAWLLLILFCLLMVYAIVAAYTRTNFWLHDSDLFMPLLGVLLLVLMVSSAIRFWERRAQWSWPFFATVLAFLGAGIFKYMDGKHCLTSQGVLEYILKFCNGECEAAEKIVCRVFGSNPVMQGHALWHMSSAFGMISLFEFFSSLSHDLKSVWPWRT